MAWAATNFDYQTDEVSHVYGPYSSRGAAIQATRQRAEAEFCELQEKFDDADLTDDLNDNGTLEITFDDDNENGCFYQVIEMTP